MENVPESSFYVHFFVCCFGYPSLWSICWSITVLASQMSTLYTLVNARVYWWKYLSDGFFCISLLPQLNRNILGNHLTTDITHAQTSCDVEIAWLCLQCIWWGWPHATSSMKPSELKRLCKLQILPSSTWPSFQSRGAVAGKSQLSVAGHF